MNVKAIWNNTVIAESDKTVLIENNRYFPHEHIKKAYFKSSGTKTTCAWKGEASYYTLEVDAKQNVDAAWFYPEVSALATSIKNHVAFWKGVEVIVE